MMSTGQVSTRPTNRRRKMLILPELQVKVIMLVLFIVLPMLLFNFVLVFGDFWSYGAADSAATYDQARAISWSIFKSFGVSIALAVPFCIAAGIALSFRFGGPLYRFHCFLGNLKEGRWDLACKLRQNDNLTFLRDDINEALKLVGERVRRQQALLKDAHALLDAGDFSDVEKVKSLSSAIGTDMALTAQRFSEPETRAAAQAAATPVQEGVHA